MKRNGVDLDRVTIGEAGTFVFASRKIGSIQGYVLGSKDYVPVAAIPAKNTKKLALYMQENLFPQMKSAPGGNVLYTSFDNMGAVFHPLLTLLWLSTMGLLKKLESVGVDIKVQHYKDVSPEMGAVMEAGDDERVSVGNAYLELAGIDNRLPSARKWLERAYGVEGTTLADALNNCDVYRGLLIPGSPNTRYIWEDARTSALAVAELGKAINIPTPVLYGAVSMCSAIFPDADFYEDGRTLENMGLKGMTPKQITNIAMYGNQDGE